ncbi:MAG: hypothetical protein ACRCY3_05840 [Sphingorhabdus sp.]
MMASFWQKWLLLWAAGIAIFGLALAGGAFAASDAVTVRLFDMFGSPLPADPDPHHRFAIGLMGAVTMGWGLTYWVTFKGLFALPAEKAAPLWRFVLLSAAVWYIVDSWISIATGIWMNAVSNTLVMTLLLIGLIEGGALRQRMATA